MTSNHTDMQDILGYSVHIAKRGVFVDIGDDLKCRDGESRLPEFDGVLHERAEMVVCAQVII